MMLNKIVEVNNNKISYILKDKKKYGKEVSVVFLCGYRSDKSGNKALFIESLRKKIGFEYLRFDYSGHGKSSGEIEKLLISDWINESKILIERLTNYPLLLIGSSMGGWISFYLSLILKKKILAIIGIAAAVDFTIRLEKKLSKTKDKLIVKSEYSNYPYTFTKKFINNSKKFLLLKKNIRIKYKSTLLYGLKDESVSLDSQIELLKRLKHEEASLMILKKSDHRMSSKKDLKILEETILKNIKYS